MTLAFIIFVSLLGGAVVFCAIINQDDDPFAS